MLKNKKVHWTKKVNRVFLVVLLGVSGSVVSSPARADDANLYTADIASSSFDYALRDADKKVDPEFHVPPALKPSVGFWLKVYTQYSTRHIVIFDGNNPELVYDVLDFREFAVKARNKVVYEIVSDLRIKKAMNNYRKAFAALAKNPHPKNPSKEQQIILSKLKEIKQPHSFKELGEGLKFIRGQRDNIIHGLQAAEEFFPKMEMIFSRLHVPVELTRLSLVESSFNLKATSKVGASGVWQFMPHIGKKFLTISDEIQVDERRSPLKSTLAAAKMLRWNEQYLGNWTLAVISYNHGLKNLPHLKGKKSDFSAMAHLFDPQDSRLGWASRSYYSEFLAVVYAEAYRKKFYGEIGSGKMNSIAFKQLPQAISGSAYAEKNGIPVKEFRALNADIEDIKQTLPEGFWVAVPSSKDSINSFVEGFLRKPKHRNHAKAPTHLAHKSVVHKREVHKKVSHKIAKSHKKHKNYT